MVFECVMRCERYRIAYLSPIYASSDEIIYRGFIFPRIWQKFEQTE